MGYAFYALSDGREAGYGVAAKCDEEGCNKDIDRGLGYVCGGEPLGYAEFGCGGYFCGDHLGGAFKETDDEEMSPQACERCRDEWRRG